MNVEASPVPPLSQEEERALLERIAVGRPDRLLVASDLHLSEGADPETGVFHVGENFFAADAFGRWLAHQEPDAARTCLVLLGDVFDFIRITHVPDTDADYDAWRRRLERLGRPDRARSLPRPLGRVETIYGLKTQDFRSLWKLMRIVRGHPAFFDALAGWVAAGGTLVVVRGNHDPELHWPLVRQAMRDELVRRGVDPPAVTKRVAFADDPFTVGNVYFEHGHEYEPMTRIDEPPTLEDQPDELRLPLGSFVNRYFINHLERLDPFLDNVKPVQGALVELLRRRPLHILKLYLRGMKFIRRALAIPRPLSRAWALLATGAFVVPFLTVGAIAAYIVFPEVRAWLDRVPTWLRIGGSGAGMLFPALLPYLVGAVREAYRSLFGRPELDRLERGAIEALQKRFTGAGAPIRAYAVMGHTHRQIVKRLPDGGGMEKLYVNSGTWIPLWPLDREDLMGRVFYTFALFHRIDHGEYQHRALEWDDQAREPVAARMLEV